MAESVVKEDFKRAKKIAETFQKVARECHGEVQRLNAMYEDFGHILSRYYEISDPMMEVFPNPADIKGQRGLPNAQPTTVMQEVAPNDKNIKSQRELPHKNGPAPAQLKEVAPNDKNIKSQRELPSGGPAPAQLKEVAPNDKNVKSQRDLPSGGPTGYNPPKDPKDTGSVKECGSPMNLAAFVRKESSVNEVSPNDSNLQSQRDLPSGGPTACNCPTPENPSVPVKPAGAGEMNVKGERDVPQGGPAPAQLKEVKPNDSNLQSQRELPRLGDIVKSMKQ
jgi:hypothetical protein